MTKRDASRQESADLYPHITAQLGTKWRVIACRDSEQWILQRKKTSWEARSHCRTSEALRRVVREHVGDVDLPELPKFLKAPVRFKNGVRVDSAPADTHLDPETRSHTPFWPV